MASEGALGDIRVIDLAGPEGAYCAKLLANLGADVVKVEAPAGSDSRRVGPFLRDRPHPERSLSCFYLDTGKKGVTLNLSTATGRRILLGLAKRADVVVETFPPGYLEKMGLGYAVLKKANPSLILTSISAYGQTGPYRQYRSSDITAQAMGGVMVRVGYPEDPPCRIGGGQSYLQSSVQGAIATLLAVLHRGRTGEGQHVDVSMHESMALVDQFAIPTYQIRKEVVRRRGALRAGGGARGFPAIWECQDGHVKFVASGAGASWEGLVRWMDSEGMAGDLVDEKWLDDETRFNEVAHVMELVGPFFKKRTKRELWETGQGRGLVINPVNDIRDVLQDPQLTDEGFFAEVQHPELDARLTYAGHPYRLSRTPWSLGRRAPLLGEHNLEVYEKELGYSKEELRVLRQSGVI